MLTDQDTVNIAYGAWQTHYKHNAAKAGIYVGGDAQLMRKWDEDRDLRTLWVGLVKGMMINTAAAVEANKRAQTPPSKASPVQSVLDRLRGNRQAAAPSAPLDSYAPAHTVVDMAPGLAIGRCTETPTDHGSSDAGPTDGGASASGSDSGSGGCD